MHWKTLLGRILLGLSCVYILVQLRDIRDLLNLVEKEKTSQAPLTALPEEKVPKTVDLPVEKAVKVPNSVGSRPRSVLKLPGQEVLSDVNSADSAVVVEQEEEEEEEEDSKAPGLLQSLASSVLGKLPDVSGFVTGEKNYTGGD